MVQSAVGRALAIALATVAMFMLLLLREATSPSGEGYWPAIAAAPGGGLYVADQPRHELRLIRPGETTRLVAPLPVAIYRALAADGATLLLAGEGHLYISRDSGRTWRQALAGRFTAVSISGSMALAGAWGDSLWRSDDRGATWSRAAIPADDSEFEALAPGNAATLLGLLQSADEGRTWVHVASLPNRVTSIRESPVLAVGDWRGRVWEEEAGGWHERAHYPGGVGSLAGAVVATTSGLYVHDRPVGGELGSREVTRVVASGGAYYAAVARGPIYYSVDGESWRVVYQK